MTSQRISNPYTTPGYTVYQCPTSSETSQPAKNASKRGHAPHTNSQKGANNEHSL